MRSLSSVPQGHVLLSTPEGLPCYRRALSLINMHVHLYAKSSKSLSWPLLMQQLQALPRSHPQRSALAALAPPVAARGHMSQRSQGAATIALRSRGLPSAQHRYINYEDNLYAQGVCTSTAHRNTPHTPDLRIGRRAMEVKHPSSSAKPVMAHAHKQPLPWSSFQQVMTLA